VRFGKMSNEELMKQIELRLRLGKLDSLFLFLPGLLGLTLSLLQFYLGIIRDQSGIVTFIPILMIGIGMPVYVGYYRGGIKLDSVVERARGWIYVVCGLSTYMLPTVGRMVDRFLPEPYWVIRLLVVAALTATLVMSLGAKIGIGILSLFGGKASEQDLQVFRNTLLAAVYLALYLSGVSESLKMLLERGLLWGIPLAIAVNSGFLIAWLHYELSARKKESAV